MKLAALVVVAVAALGCQSKQSWDGPAEVRLKDGTVMQCQRGLSFNRKHVECHQTIGGTQDFYRIPWDAVAGYTAR